MAASVHLELGNGPLVVLLHGVGLGPSTFAPLAERLADDHRVVVVARPDGGSVEAQADAVAHLIGDLGGHGSVVGVSGGATIGLALAVRRPDLAAAFILHEPLVGPVSPKLHERFVASAARAADSDEAAIEVVRAVMGDATWAGLDAAQRSAVAAGAARWRREVPAFAAFEPSPALLHRLVGVSMLTTVGARSDPDRRSAAAVLHDLAGAEVALVADAGNAVHLDAPDAFAALLRSWIPAPVGGRS